MYNNVIEGNRKNFLTKMRPLLLKCLLLLTLTFCISASDEHENRRLLAPLLGIKEAIGHRVSITFKNPVSERSLETFGNQLRIKIPSAKAACDRMIFLDADKKLLKKIRLHPMVKQVEYVQKVKAFGKSCSVINSDATWGVARISQRTFTDQKTYSSQPGAGKGVRIYVIDTGTNIAHTVFGGRAKWAANFVPNSPDTDEQGHGTCTAGLAATVSTEADIYVVKVLNKDGSGTNEWVIKGICYAADQAKQTRDRVVINMSLGGPFSSTTNDAVRYARRAGVGVVVAAGNEAQLACNVSPASSPDAFTVAASDINDVLSGFSNYGRCVDIIAPGQALSCPSHTSTTGSIEGVSGTSLASPIVAGLLANTLTVYNIKRGADGYFLLKQLALKNVVKGNRMLTPNLLANNRCRNE